MRLFKSTYFVLQAMVRRPVSPAFFEIGFYPALVAGMMLIILTANGKLLSSCHRIVLISTLLFFGPVPAIADTFDAVYRARLSGIPIGTARLSGGLEAGKYTISLKGEASFLGLTNRFEAFSSGASRDSRILPASYQLKTDGRNARTIEVNFSGDRASTVSITPQFAAADQEGRLPLEASHRKDVLDPMSAIMTEILRAARSESPCSGTAQVFTGNVRFDMKPLSSDLADNEIVCRAVYRPIAGHRPSSSTAPTVIVVAYDKAARSGGVRLPLRIEVPLPIGTVTIRRAS
jgi:hypothetical protein